MGYGVRRLLVAFLDIVVLVKPLNDILITSIFSLLLTIMLTVKVGLHFTPVFSATVSRFSIIVHYHDDYSLTCLIIRVLSCYCFTINSYVFLILIVSFFDFCFLFVCVRVYLF